MKNKRIAVISYHTCPLSDEKVTETGGMNVYVLELSKELAKKGYTVDIYTRSVDKKTPKIIQAGPNLRVIHLKSGKQEVIDKKQLIKHIPEFLNNYYNFLKHEKLEYDLVSCHYYLSGLIGLGIKEKLKIPLIITFHTLALMKNLVARNEEEKEDVQRIKTEIALTKNADKVIATSKTDLEYIHTLYNCPFKKIFILTPGVNLEIFNPIKKNKAKKIIGANLNHKLILFVGRIEPLKGIDMLFYALKNLVWKNPEFNLCLWIVGGRKDKLSKELKRLDDLKKLLKITTYVKFVGAKTQKELVNYYSASEIVIMPSQYESFGIIALESMACGVPVITTDATGVSGLFDKKHSSLVTSVGNPILLSKKINDLITNEKKHEKISLELFNKVQDLSWKNVADRFIREVLQD